MHWTVAVPFIHDSAVDGDWLRPCVPGYRHQFTIVPHGTPLANWHNQSSDVTSYQRWLRYFSQGLEAVKRTQGRVITVFPQLASAVGMDQQIYRKRIPIVAWLFNVGQCYSGMRRYLASSVKAPLGLNKQDCIRLSQEARVNVIPLRANQLATAAGQVTIVEAMRMGRAIIASRCNGAEDYLIHGKTGLLVEPGSVEALSEAIDLLWNDVALREQLSRAASYAAEHFSDEAAGFAMGRLLDPLADSYELTAHLQSSW